MSKKEEILLNEPEIVVTKPSKIRIAVSIIISTLLVSAVTTLLIGHFKFDWFKSDSYKIDANINRSVYQANYFSEKKTVTTKFKDAFIIAFKNGERVDAAEALKEFKRRNNIK